jgi:hypothetical protein
MPLDRASRLGFTPVGERVSLLSLLRSVSLPNAFGGPTKLADIFFPSQKIGVTQYADVLSPVPRELVALHHRLVAVIDALADERALCDAVARELLLHGVSVGVRQTGRVTDDGAEYLSITSDALAQPLVRLGLDRLNLFSPTFPPQGGREETGRSAVRSEKQASPALPGRVRLGVIGPTLGRLRADQENERSPRAGDALTSSLLLGHELIAVYGVLGGRVDLRSLSHVPSMGGTYTRLIRCAGTDNQFLLLPEWEAYFDFWLFESRWAEILSLSSGLVLDDPGVVASVVVEAWASLVSIQKNRRLQPERLLSAVRAPTTARLSRRFVATLGAIGEMYSSCLDSRAATLGFKQRQRDFATWVEIYLPQILHPAVIGPARVRQVLEWQRSLFDSVGTAERVRRELHSFTARRIRESLGEDWIVPFFELLDPEHDETPYLRERQADRAAERARNRASRQGAFAVDSAGSVVEVPTPGAREPSRSRGFTTAMETLDELERSPIESNGSE